MADKQTRFSAEKVIAEFERLTRDAAAVQRETLRRILAGNATTEYLRGLGLAGRTDPDSFRACVPLCTHADLEPYIARIADEGDTSHVLTEAPVNSFSLSSGTTQGKRKYLLFNDDLFKCAMQTYQTSFAFRNRAFPVEDGKSLQFVYASRQYMTKGGLTATTVTSNLYRHKDFKANMRQIQSEFCSPSEVLFCPDFAESLYCHLLCGLLLADNVRTVSATFAHTLVLAFQTFENLWEELCADIRHGVLSPTRVTNPVVRQAVSALLLAPNPALADEVARICGSLTNWYGVIPALWPKARYVYTIVTGSSMEHYVKKLRHYAGGLPLVAYEYGASEGMIAANVEPWVPPESATFVVPPNNAYFEFIPLSIGGCDVGDIGAATAADPVGLTDVAVGEHYEVVMTTFGGLYRYRLGDVVKVTGFYNSAPKIKVVCRRNIMLNINIDKNSEHDLQLAVDSAAKILAAEKLEVVEYTSYANVSRDPGHYVVFWELNAEADTGILQSCCDELDRAFTDPGYVGSRKARAIGPLELQVLQRGTFQKVLQHYLSHGSPMSQFKMPRCVTPSNSAGGGVLEILTANTVKAFFSTAYD